MGKGVEGGEASQRPLMEHRGFCHFKNNNQSEWIMLLLGRMGGGALINKVSLLIFLLPWYCLKM